MESVAIFPAIAGLLNGDTRTGVLRAVLLTGLLAAACLAASRIGWLRTWRWQIPVGFILAALVNLALTAPAALGAGVTFLGVAGWLVTSIPATGLGGGAWWRGLVVADTEISRDEVRTEFILLGGALMVMLMLFRPVLGLADGVLLALVGLFLGSGLAAVALARQEAAGTEHTPGPTGLVLVLAVLPVALALGLVTVLQPSVVAAAMAPLTVLADLLLALLQFLLAPLAHLLSFWHVEFQPTAARPSGGIGAAARPTLEIPDWVVWTAVGLGVVLALLVAGFLIWILATTILPALFSDRAKAKAPDDVEEEGDVGDDARALANGLGVWVAGLLRWAEQHARREHREMGDVRAVYRTFLRWAQTAGLGRQEAETPGQLQERLSAAYPDDHLTFTRLTTAYESQRYGERQVPPDELATLVRQMDALLGPPES